MMPRHARPREISWRLLEEELGRSLRFDDVSADVWPRPFPLPD